MASINLPPTTSSQGIAFAREFAELISRYFRDPAAGGYVPQENSKDPGGNGPFGTCPRCKLGQVVRQHRRDGGSHLQCSLGDYKDKNTCQWKAWDVVAQNDFFAGKAKAWGGQRQFVPKQSIAETSTAAAVPNESIKLAAEVIELLYDLPQDRRNQILEPLGYDPKGSYVHFINQLERRQVLKIKDLIVG